MSSLNLPLPTISSTVTLRLQYGHLQLLTAPMLEPAVNPPPEIYAPLSPRQAEVLQLLVQGLSNKEIARALDLAVGTVKIHVAALFHKLGVTSRTAAAVAGARLLSSMAAPRARSAPPHPAQAIGGAYPFGPAHLSAAA